jgi:hypothetical protein
VLLVGAIVLAFIVLALVPVFNGVFAPDSAGSNEPPEVGEGPATLRAEQQSTARELAVRIGHGDTHAAPAPVVDELSSALANYTRVSAESAAEQRGWFVETRLNTSAPGTVNGTRVVQREQARLVLPNGDARTWQLIPPGQRTELGWFVLRLDTSNLSDEDPLVVRVGNAPTDEMTVEIERQENSRGVELSVGGAFETTDEPVVCDATNGQVVLDLYRGRSADRDCAFPALRGVDGPVDIEVQNPPGTPDERAVGVYDLVVRDGSSITADVDPCTDASATRTEPCTTPVLWQLALETTVDGGRATYTTAQNVSVYGGGER